MMKTALSVTALLLLASPASAQVYKCTDANGQISFGDKPCGTQQEVVEIREQPARRDVALATPDDFSNQSAPTEPSAGGNAVSGSSPLASVYMGFISALNRCDRDALARYITADMAAEMQATNATEFTAGCMILREFMPSNFDGATEVINGDTGTIHWSIVESSSDGDSTSTMSWETSAEFVKEDGEWKFTGN